MIEIDHLFICSKNDGDEVNLIAESGFTEGEGRDHPGQGTTNRKFVFSNFFLEILWIKNQDEIQSDRIEKTGLTKRLLYDQNECSPFGLCLVNTPETDTIFKDAIKYQPDYFPKGKIIDILPNENQPLLPWIFRLPFRKEEQETIRDFSHINGVKSLTEITLEIPESDMDLPLISKLNSSDQLSFRRSSKPGIILTFDSHQQQTSQSFKSLFLRINY